MKYIPARTFPIAAILLVASSCAQSEITVVGPLEAANTPSVWNDFYRDIHTDTFPSEFRDFIIRWQACGHFSGEPWDDSEPERKAFLEQRIEETCTGLDEQAANFEKAYQDDPNLLEGLRRVIAGDF